MEPINHPGWKNLNSAVEVAAEAMREFGRVAKNAKVSDNETGIKICMKNPQKTKLAQAISKAIN